MASIDEPGSTNNTSLPVPELQTYVAQIPNEVPISLAGSEIARLREGLPDCNPFTLLYLYADE